MNNEMIKQLQATISKFGNLNEADQEFMVRAGKKNCEVLNDDGKHIPAELDKIFQGDEDGQAFIKEYRYRLSPDYVEEAKVFEWLIKPDSKGKLRFHHPTEDWVAEPISDAVNHIDFAGFKFEDYDKNEVYMETWLNLDMEHTGNYVMTHASHVLFRKATS